MRIKQLLIAVGVGTMLAACSSTEDYKASDDNVIRLKAKINSIKTRAGESSSDLLTDKFHNGEEINVYLKNATNGENVSGVESDYLTYIADNNYNLSTNAEPKYPEDGSKVDVYAIHPSTVNMTHSEFTVKDEQNDDADYRASDLMYATLNNRGKSDGNLELNFEHMLSKVIVKIDVGDTGADLSTTDFMKIQNVFKTIGITHDIKTGLSLGDGSSLSNKGDIYFDMNTSTYDYEQGWTAIVIPQTIEPNTKLISFFCDGFTYTFTTTTPITFESGKKHIITLTLDNSNVSVSCYLIQIWDDGTNYSGEGTTGN